MEVWAAGAVKHRRVAIQRRPPTEHRSPVGTPGWCFPQNFTIFTRAVEVVYARGIPAGSIKAIWTLLGKDDKGNLEGMEFVVAMHLTDKYYSTPSSLPLILTQLFSTDALAVLFLYALHGATWPTKARRSRAIAARDKFTSALVPRPPGRLQSVS
ncbi:hypothetical protein MCOR02_001078 [Pyricularia oryzae]|nr:hypothetical protein MCOR02_001078 [Pyricularia oryzae]KAI6309888.1 hypothetical protein MCOR34_006617 [Pyricularia oryzae]KAI6444960.1 hypothetical protein MCOR17_011082 [Pyricularia oryzae]KAI6501395.1 hypothetical protein MCOR13_005657 [Pyricularia oryzae]KAI6580649.1 hypothetical protein MCOR04_005682 [Pyricularia oryzae]